MVRGSTYITDSGGYVELKGALDRKIELLRVRCFYIVGAVEVWGICGPG